MTLKQIKEIRAIGLHNIEDKRRLKEYALINGLSDKEVLAALHADSVEELLEYFAE